MERSPATIAEMRLAGTCSAWASRFMLIPKSSSVSLRIAPGWMGASLKRPAVLAVMFRDFDIFRSSCSVGELFDAHYGSIGETCANFQFAAHGFDDSRERADIHIRSSHRSHGRSEE